MEKKETVEKKLPIQWILVIAGIVFAVIGVILYFLLSREESYRQIQVYKVEGTADVERETIGMLEAYANMMLQTKDIVNVSEDSNLQLKLDEDKYILLEPKTKIRLEAAGNSTDSKTKIYLEEGAIVCNLEKKLSEDSTYEVNTPNSTMAVRGTTFRVAVEYDEEGNSYTVVAVYEGEIESYLIYPNGDIEKEGVSIPAGTQVQIKGTAEESLYITTNQEISYEELEQITLEFLKKLIEKGEELSVTKEELEAFLTKKISRENADEIEEMETEQEQEQESETLPVQSTETENAELTENSDSEGSVEIAGNIGSEQNTEETNSENHVEITGDTGSEKEPESTDSEKKTEDEETEKEPTDNESEEEPKDSETEEEPEETESEKEPEDSNSEEEAKDSESEDTESKENTEDESAGEDADAGQEETYTISFYYNGEIFATQKVISGACAVKPELMPTAAGSWKFDFTNKITADTSIEWIDSDSVQQ